MENMLCDLEILLLLNGVYEKTIFPTLVFAVLDQFGVSSGVPEAGDGTSDHIPGFGSGNESRGKGICAHSRRHARR
jgi:hypothetical protein